MQEHAKIGLFGANSTGKTLQIRSLIETFGVENVAIVSCEDGLKVIGSSIDQKHVKECNSIRDLKEAWKWASDNYSGFDKWVCVDGGTRALEWIAGEIWAGTDAVYSLLALEVPRDEWRKELRSFTRFITEKGAIDGQRQWMEIGRMADFELSRWVKLPANTYWTFWEDHTSKGQYEKGLPWTADGPGKGSRDAIYRALDFIFRITADGETFTVTHDPSRRVVRSKARDDWQAGIKVPQEMAKFSLGSFVTNILRIPAPQPVLMEAK